MTKRLWEIEHPYYMTEGNYFKAGEHREFESWQEYITEWEDADIDYNWIVRWDWLEGEGWNAGEYTGDDYYRNGVLKIQMLGQRKAYLFSMEVSVCRADEPAVREYLSKYWNYMREMWEPLSLAPETNS